LRITDKDKDNQFIETLNDEDPDTNDTNYGNFLDAYAFIQLCNSGASVCTEESENSLYLNLFRNFLIDIEAGISLYSSTSVDANGNPEWEFVVSSGN